MERDDIYEYSLDTHHDEATGVKIRKKILVVTALLTLITVVEVFLGAFIKQGTTIWPLVKWSFLFGVLFQVIVAVAIILKYLYCWSY